ncbi:putative immunity protein [Mycobacterium sp. B14F4]|uniref:putative immunity protein n=1 Tax=Mycobacterium sp. B14F4 TaxID=3153565 RepID=UPI00325D20F7
MAETAFELDVAELREVARYAAACARTALPIFVAEFPGDRRPCAAVDAAQQFADGAGRTKLLRDAAWAAMRAAQEARDGGRPAASDAARAAVGAASAAYLHPLAKATQVKHILGSAAHAARAFQLAAGGDPSVADEHLARFRDAAGAVVVDVPEALPAGSARRRAGR